MLAECDIDSNGSISEAEFVKLCQKKFLGVYQSMCEDENKDGHITLERMKRVYHKAGVEVCLQLRGT